MDMSQREYDPENPTMEGRPMRPNLGTNSNTGRPIVDPGIRDQHRLNASKAESLGVNVGDCFAFARTGSCKNGDGCSFKHHSPDTARSTGMIITAPPRVLGSNAGANRRSHSTKPSKLLEVTEIPQNLNNMLKLSEHFSKFGSVVEIRCGKNANDERNLKAAVVKYSTVAAAMKAHGDADAILGNRFIIAQFAVEGGSQTNAHSSSTNLAGKGFNKSFNKSLNSSTNARLQAKKQALAAAAAKPKAKLAKPSAAGKATKAVPSTNSKQMQALQAKQQALLQTLLAKQKSLLQQAKNPKLSIEKRKVVLKAVAKLSQTLKPLMASSMAVAKAVRTKGKQSADAARTKQEKAVDIGAVAAKPVASDHGAGAATDSGHRLAVLGLPASAGAADIVDHFKVYGEVLAFESAQDQGEATVSFKERADAQKVASPHRVVNMWYRCAHGKGRGAACLLVLLSCCLH